MPGFYEIRWLPHGRTEKFAGSRGNYYEFEDGSHLDMQTTPIWCRHCGKVTHGEKIEPLAEIDKQLADLHDPGSELYRYTRRSLLPGLDELIPRGDTFRLEMIENAKKRRWWREQRRAAPKCIVCGSTDIFVFPVNQKVPHPAGPGTVEVSIVGMCSTSFNQWFFTPEGDRIPRDTQPTYWHHPELDKPEHKKRLQQWLRSLPVAIRPQANQTCSGRAGVAVLVIPKSSGPTLWAARGCGGRAGASRGRRPPK